MILDSSHLLMLWDAASIVTSKWETSERFTPGTDVSSLTWGGGHNGTVAVPWATASPTTRARTAWKTYLKLYWACPFKRGHTPPCTTLWPQWHCGCTMSYRIPSHKGPYSLKDLSKAVLGLSIQEGPHSALHDALATMALWLYHELPCNKGEWTRINKVCVLYIYLLWMQPTPHYLPERTTTQSHWTTQAAWIVVVTCNSLNHSRYPLPYSTAAIQQHRQQPPPSPQQHRHQPPNSSNRARTRERQSAIRKGTRERQKALASSSSACWKGTRERYVHVQHLRSGSWTSPPAVLPHPYILFALS